MSDNQKIINYLKTRKKGLTSLECLYKLGTMSLRSRISELRAAGYPIGDEWIKPPSNRRCKRYFFDENKAA